MEFYFDAPTIERANGFWNETLKPLIRTTFDADGGESRAKGDFVLKPRRTVRFWDIEGQILDRKGFNVRRRAKTAGGKPEVTLKFRSPDIMLAAEMYPRVKDIYKDTQFEEDIGPLQVASKTHPDICFPKQPDMRSRFAVSIDEQADAGTDLSTLDGVFGLFETFEEDLERAGDKKLSGGTALRQGPTVCEWVFGRAKVDLGKWGDSQSGGQVERIEAEFALSLWYFLDEGADDAACDATADGSVPLRVAEISFQIDLRGPKKSESESGDQDMRLLPEKATRRASKLFKAMQGLHLNQKDTSKTTLALPA